MKKLLFTLSIALIAISGKAATDSVSIIAKPSNAMFCYLDDSPTDTGSRSYGQSMVIARWTSSGIPHTWRSLLKIDLGAVPAGSIIDSAFISLRANPTSVSGNPGNPTWGTSNAVGLYRITDAWDTATVTWGTQPAYTTVHGDTLVQSTTTAQNYLRVNVTDLVNDAYTLGNNGFLFKHLQETATLNSMIFYSPEIAGTDSTLAPELVIYYTPPTAIRGSQAISANVHLFPNPAAGLVNLNIYDCPAGDVTVTLFDCTGKRCLTEQFYPQGSTLKSNLNIAKLLPGMYFVRITFGNETSVNRQLLVR